MIPAVLLISFLVLFAIVMVAVSLGYRFLESQRKRSVQGLLDAVSGESAGVVEPTVLMEQRVEDPLEGFLKNVGFRTPFERFIQQAGVDWTPGRLMLVILIGAGVGAAIGAVVRPFGFFAPSIAALAILFGSLPYFYLRIKRAKRIAAFEEQLPEALDFLARSMRAGHAFSISLEMLGQESPDPLGQEFRILFNEQNLGAPLDVALASFAGRVPLLDIRLFVSSILLQRQTGGNLSEILIRLAYVIRERFKLKRQVKAASAHGRMTAAILTILPFVTMIALLIIAPGYLQGMAADSDGKWMIAGAIVAQVVGYFIMQKIVNIKV